MGRIRILPDLLVNKIAAGEVIDRPASVVKELLENAIDSGATHLDVAIEEGGSRLMRVADDGCGMSPDDLVLAVTPHATSKLADEDDLYRIGTLGFRGEALASIGAVSNLRIVSRQADAVEGGEIRVSGERVESCGAAGCPVGTTVEVRDLFFNVPARRKFLKTAATEFGHIHDHVTRIALGRPDIGVELTHGKRNVQRLSPSQSRLDRIAALFSPEMAEELIQLQREERGLTIEGYVAPPAHTRSTAAGQYVYVNGRFIRDRVLSYVIRESFRGLMEPTRHPIVYLFLSIDPASVDVNVHPTKIEVRWSDVNLVRSIVLSVLRETLLRADLTPALRATPAATIDPAQQDALRRQMADEFKRALPTAGGYAAGGGGGRRIDGGPQRPTYNDAAAMWRSMYGERPGEPGDVRPTDGDDTPHSRHGDNAGDTQHAAFSQRRPTVQMHNAYLVTETDDGLIIIDQHALHERVIYEDLRSRLAEGRLESQRLLLPETIDATPREQALLDEHGDLLGRLGIEVSRFGAGSIAVQSFPSLLKNVDPQAFMRDLLDKLGRHDAPPDPESMIHELLDMMACKAAVKAGDALTPEEIDALLAKRDMVDRSSNCPHGRPTSLRFNLQELERQFKRR